MSAPGDVPPDVLARLRPICLGLPETYEEPAWVGIRWRVRRRTFAHVRTVEPDGQPVHERAAATDQPVCRLVFRSPLDEIAGLLGHGHPFYKPDWAANVLGMVLDDATDWDEVDELLTESYSMMAPKRLAALVGPPARPPG
ncbi:MmcQ/YjbR family DNA-binding protein [Micromonospora tarensis]|uniref:MmcQ/YjbR family DNA-binding protein n=1 Tax=Micromonospora tarensis TaxID=2806100 RepID=A0ABS1YJ22_9ACTN|nr:MmcQ/YjbR family DNA-binding protein [Micromonospora tarensis]MBM0277362.1 MmcQ/YjbR family DNA-binding protein [Micromonospora tarensis]